MIFIGDVHGDFQGLGAVLKKVSAERPDEPIIQIGDLGVGFGKSVPHYSVPWKFFRGNHDNPDEARALPNHLGDFGYFGEEPPLKGLFFVAGGLSVDKNFRLERYRAGFWKEPFWWPDEELSEESLEMAYETYKANQPNIVATHEPPAAIADLLTRMALASFSNDKRFPSRTGKWLERMLNVHQPQYWVFGHWHIRWRKKINSTVFYGLPELGHCRVVV